MNILITGAWKASPEALIRIQKLGNAIIFQPNEAESLVTRYEEVEAVICNGLFIHHPLERFTNLKYIQLTSAGFDRVPLDQILCRGIKIFNARGVYSTPMAEFALAGVMDLYKQMRFFKKNQDRHVWEKHRGLSELSGKTVCVIGCGSVGQCCAKVFSALGCHVLGIDISPFPCDAFSGIYPMEELDRFLSCSDIVICCLPLTDDTFHLFEENKFATMKNGAVFVNISRGQVVHTSSLIDALQHKLRGAVLDVFEEEPLNPDNPLWDMDNVILTPHNSFVGEGNSTRLEKVILENLENIQ